MDTFDPVVRPSSGIDDDRSIPPQNPEQQERLESTPSASFQGMSIGSPSANLTRPRTDQDKAPTQYDSINQEKQKERNAGECGIVHEDETTFSPIASRSIENDILNGPTTIEHWAYGGWSAVLANDGLLHQILTYVCLLYTSPSPRD